MEINLKQARWSHKEYDVVPKSEDNESGLISPKQLIEVFPGCYGFSLSHIGDVVYALGSIGQNRVALYILNLESLELEEEKRCEDIYKLQSESFVHKAVVCNERLYIVYNICPQNPNCLAIYDPTSQSLYPIRGDTASSTFRLNYTATEYKGQAFIFGGLSEHGEVLNSTEIFDFTTYRWRAVTTHGKVPPARHNHVACLHKSYIYVYGGTADVVYADPTPLTDMHILEVASSTWTPVRCSGPLPKGHPITLGPIDDTTLILFPILTLPFKPGYIEIRLSLLRLFEIGTRRWLSWRDCI